MLRRVVAIFDATQKVCKTPAAVKEGQLPTFSDPSRPTVAVLCMPWPLRIVGCPNSAHFDGTLVPGRSRPQHQIRTSGFQIAPQTADQTPRSSLEATERPPTRSGGEYRSSQKSGGVVCREFNAGLFRRVREHPRRAAVGLIQQLCARSLVRSEDRSIGRTACTLGQSGRADEACMRRQRPQVKARLTPRVDCRLRDLRSLRDPADLIARYRHSAASTRKWLHALVRGVTCRRIWHKLRRAAQGESAPSRPHMCGSCRQVVNAAPFFVHTLQCGRKDLFSVERQVSDAWETPSPRLGFSPDFTLLLPC